MSDTNTLPQFNQRYIKENVSQHEALMYQRAGNILTCVPKFISYDPETHVMITEKIPQMNIADMYGENENEIELYIWEDIQDILSTLYRNGIVYPDVTGYNFIEYDNKIWIIDFEHAQYIQDIEKNGNKVDQFVLNFIHGQYKWNDYYK